MVKWQGYRLVAAISFVVLAISILGCGDGGPYRETVSGTVTFDGQPLESGEILFMPSAGGGTPEGGPITDGKFEFRAIPGAKRIEISATREDAKPAADGLPNYVSFIPDRYNRKSTLSESVEEGGNNVFTFDLKSGN